MAPASLQARFIIYDSDGYLTYPARVWIGIAVTLGIMILLLVAFCMIRSTKTGGLMSRWRKNSGRQQQRGAPITAGDISYQGAGRHSEDLESGRGWSVPGFTARQFDHGAGKERHSSVPLVDYASNNARRPVSSASRHEGGFEGTPLPPPTYQEATVVAKPPETRH